VAPSSWQIPFVGSVDAEMQRAGGMQPGPTPVVEHGEPSAAAVVQVPVAPASLVLHVPLAAHAVN